MEKIKIIPPTECDLIPMYCEKKGTDAAITEDMNITYVLTTKTLIHSKGEQFETISEVSEELKNKILREFFGIKYVKDEKKRMIYDQDPNFKFISLAVKNDDNEGVIEDGLEKYIQDSKSKPGFIICIQGKKDMNLNIDELEKIEHDNNSAVKILYKNSEKLSFKPFNSKENASGIYETEGNIEILSQCFKAIEKSNNESILTVININNIKKDIMNKFVPDIKSISFKKLLKKLILKIVRKNKYINDIDILLYDLIISGDFSDTNFKEDIEDVFNDIINNDQSLIKININNKKISIKGETDIISQNIKYICDFVDNPSCLLNIDNNQKSISDHILKNFGNKGVFVSENFKVVDVKPKKFQEDNLDNIKLFEFKGIIESSNKLARKDLDKKTTAEIKILLENEELKVNGKKEDLMQRYLDYINMNHLKNFFFRC